MIGILALIVVIVAAVFAYRTANDNGRSGPLWALAALGAGFGLQIVIPMIIGIILALIYLAKGVPVEELAERVSGPSTAVAFVMWFLSFVGLWLILRYISKPIEEKPMEVIPPPPTFHQTD